MTEASFGPDFDNIDPENKIDDRERARRRAYASQGVPVDFLLKCVATQDQIKGCNVAPEEGLDGKPLEKRREH